MPASAFAHRSKLLPFETSALEAVANALPHNDKQLFRQQSSAINKVQRLLDWNEIEFYSMHWFKVRWPESALFDRRDEHCLAEINCAFGNTEVTLSVWAVGGHVFSIECPIGLRAIHTQGAINIRSVQCKIEPTSNPVLNLVAPINGAPNNAKL